jgi:quinoprotein glucose dehydrogenase
VATQLIRPWVLLACVLVALATLSPTIAGRQAPPAAAAQVPATVRVSAADAARLAKEIRAKVSVELPPGLELTLWASDSLVTDPIAIDLDPQGNAYVVSSTRINMPLDIRGHPDWVPLVHTLKTVDDLRAFYRRELAPERSTTNKWIPDLNKDGSRDGRDFSELKERIRRVQDTDGDGFADLSQVMIEGFNADPVWEVAGGVAYDGGDLIFGDAPGVYRLRDTNRDGTIDQQIPISEGYNVHPAFGGHGISGVMMGPDGRLYWEVGDIGFTVVDKSGRTWSYPNQGAVLRSEPDGSGFEVFATGIRNLQEFSFDEHGNLISVDNDGDHQGESERVVYIPYGSDSGWRSNWQYGKYTDPKNNRYNVWMDEGLFKPRHAGQSAAIVPPIANWHAGPSGMVYNPGTALSDEWKRHFFVTSFQGSPSGARIYGFTLKEDGAGFAMDAEKTLLRGILAVGVKFGPDGALYVTDWITGWSAKNDGRLWKVDAPAVADSAIRKEVKSLLTEDFAAKGSADVAALLRHADMRVRQKAQFDLVRRNDAQTLVAAARDSSNGLGRLHAIWGIGQLARKDPRQAAPLATLLGDSDAEVRAQAAKLIGDIRDRASAPKLEALLKDAAPRVRFFAAEALGRTGHRPATGPLVEMLAANDDRDVYLRHAGSLALSQIADSAAIAALSTHQSRAVRLAAVVALRRMRDAGVARFLADADELVVAEAARAINDDGGIVAALPQLAASLSEARFTNEPLLRRAISASLRVGTTGAVKHVATFAANSARPEPLRVEAIAALGVWGAPSTMDRVDGYYLASAPPPASAAEKGLPTPVATAGQSTGGRRDGAEARAALQELIAAQSKAENAMTTPAIKVAIADAAARLELTAVAPMLLAQLKTDPAQEVRLASLRALQTLKAGNMDELMQIALADKDPAIRKAALGILPGMAMSEAAKVQHLSTAIKGGTLPEKQGAIQVLGTLKSAEARKALTGFVAELTAGTLAPDLQVDVLEAVEASGDAKLGAALEAHQKSRKAETLVAAFRPGLLTGGDPRRGVQVIMQNPAAECTRCHSAFGQGSNVGPDLTKIGGTLTREQILEALLEPNARIAPGYGTVSLTLRDGQVVVMAGTPPAERRVPKSEIAQRSNPVSAMPPMGLILKPREIRDIVEFLSTLK